MVLAGRLPIGDRNKHRMISRSAVEALALRTYQHRRHMGNELSYWVTSQRAAEILGVTVARLHQLIAKGFVPYEVQTDGTRLYRREQLEVVANARQARCGTSYGKGPELVVGKLALPLSDRRSWYPDSR